LGKKVSSRTQNLKRTVVVPLKRTDWAWFWLSINKCWIPSLSPWGCMVLSGLCRGPRPLRYQYKFGAQISRRLDAHLSLADNISTPTLDRGRGGGRWHCITDLRMLLTNYIQGGAPYHHAAPCCLLRVFGWTTASPCCLLCANDFDRSVCRFVIISSYVSPVP
jgi:hypothetical protein